jgi:cell wall-associated NlpC family hydrolase
LICLTLSAGLQAFDDGRGKGPDPSAVRRAGENIQQLLFGQAILREAKRHLGQPYAWGGEGGDDGKGGFDCSGYTQFVFKTFGMDLPRTALAQYQKGIEIEKPALMPGDLVFFLSSGAPMHVGIYAGDGKFFHAPKTGDVISEESLSKGPYSQRYLGARRYAAPKAETSTTRTKEKQP